MCPEHGRSCGCLPGTGLSSHRCRSGDVLLPLPDTSVLFFCCREFLFQQRENSSTPCGKTQVPAAGSRAPSAPGSTAAPGTAVTLSPSLPWQGPSRLPPVTPRQPAPRAPPSAPREQNVPKHACGRGHIPSMVPRPLRGAMSPLQCCVTHGLWVPGRGTEGQQDRTLVQFGCLRALFGKTGFLCLIFGRAGGRCKTRRLPGPGQLPCPSFAVALLCLETMGQNLPRGGVHSSAAAPAPPPPATTSPNL